MNPKLFRWPCGALFEARLTPTGKNLQYRQIYSKDAIIGRWRSGGSVKAALAVARGENPHGVDPWTGQVIVIKSRSTTRYPDNTAAARRCIRRMLKYLGVL